MNFARSFEIPPRWTRAHEKFAKAWGDLQQALARTGAGCLHLGDWMFSRWRVRRVVDLTTAQARAGCRQLNAWRGSIERRCDGYREFPRQWRRNQRRAATARNAAGAYTRAVHLALGVRLPGGITHTDISP